MVDVTSPVPGAFIVEVVCVDVSVTAAIVTVVADVILDVHWSVSALNLSLRSMSILLMILLEFYCLGLRQSCWWSDTLLTPEAV